MNNYPVSDCLNQTKCAKTEILGFRNYWEKYQEKINEESSIVEFAVYWAKQMVRHIDVSEKDDETSKIPNEVTCIAEKSGEYEKWLDALIKSEDRLHLINRGETYARMFYKHIQNLEIVGDTP